MKRKKRMTVLMSSVLFLSSINVPPSAFYAETQGNADASYIDGDVVSGGALEVKASDDETSTADLAAVTETGTEAPSVTTEESEIYFDESTGTITGCDTTVTDLVIPETINGVEVKAIAEGAFSNKSHLKSVIIPDCVTTIGKNAFYKCTGLQNVQIGNGVTNIAINAFYGCTSIKSVNIGSGVEIIDDYAFYGCSSLEEVTGMESVREIGVRAFYSNYVLKSVPVGDSLEIVEDYAFPSYVKFSELPKNIKRIGINGFAVDAQLVTIPASVEYMNNNAVYGSARIYVFEGEDIQLETAKPVGRGDAYVRIVPVRIYSKKLKMLISIMLPICMIRII